MPNHGCDISVCEIAQFFRLYNDGFCQVMPFTVLRKSEPFQEDLYPDTQATVPAITANEWWSGTYSGPILVPMTQQKYYAFYFKCNLNSLITDGCDGRSTQTNGRNCCEAKRAN